MKEIGLIGGTSWESTQHYYQIINKEVNARLGGFHSAKILMSSVDFAEIMDLMENNEWENMAKFLSHTAQKLEQGGADCVLICTNTLHKVADDVQKNIDIPLIHIADSTAKKIVENNFHQIGLLGTKLTMEEDFYKGRLVNRHNLDVIIPNDTDRQIIHSVIFNELCQGEIKDESRQKYTKIIESLGDSGAKAIILGCTEIASLISPRDTKIPLFDTTKIHALSAVDFALK